MSRTIECYENLPASSMKKDLFDWNYLSTSIIPVCRNQAYRVSDPHEFYVDPDAAFHFDADPDPDPAPLQSEGNLRPQGSVLSL